MNCTMAMGCQRDGATFALKSQQPVTAFVFSTRFLPGCFCQSGVHRECRAPDSSQVPHFHIPTPSLSHQLSSLTPCVCSAIDPSEFSRGLVDAKCKKLPAGREKTGVELTGTYSTVFSFVTIDE